MGSTEQSQVPEPTVPTLPITVHVNDSVVVVGMSGQLDATTAAACREELLGLCDVCVGTLIIEITDSSGLSAAAESLLRAAHWHCLHGRCQIEVSAENPDVLAALALAGLPRATVTGSAPARELAGRT